MLKQARALLEDPEITVEDVAREKRGLSPNSFSSAVTMSTFHRTRHGDNNFIIDGEFYGFNFDLFDI